MKASKFTHSRKRKAYGIVLTLAFVLLSTGAFAQFSWSGTQTLQNGNNITQNITFTGDVTINVATNATATISGTITGGNYNLTKTGGGTLILTANNNLQQAVNVDGGTLQLGNGGSTGSTGAQGVFIKRSNSIIGLVQNVGRLVINRTGTYYCESIGSSGTGSYLGNVVKQGSGTMLIGGDYTTFTGNLVIQTGTAVFGNNAGGGSANGSIGGNVSVDAGATLRFNRSNAYTYSGVISGAGSVEHTGKSTLTFTGVHTFTGKMTVNAGTTGNMGFLRLNDGSSITSASELELTTALSEVVFVCTSGDLAFNKPITGAGNVQKLGGSSVWITTQPTYTGHTAVTEGAVCFIASTLPTSRIYFVSSAAHTVQIEVPSGQTLEYPNLINEDNGAAAGNLIKSGAGKLILSGANTYTGTTTVHDGTLQIGNGTSGSIGSTASVDLTLTTSVLRFQPGTAMNFSKVISGSGKLEYSGTNTVLRLIADNTYTGTTTIEAGTLSLGYNTTAGSVAGDIINNDILYFYRSNAYTYSGVISGTGTVFKFGAGTTTLNGSNTYTGTTQIGGGTLALGANGTIAASSGVILSNNTAKFDISAGSKDIKALSTFNNTYTGAEVILGIRRLTIGTSGQSDGGGTYAGKITGTATGTALRKYGAATLTLSGISTYTGYTYIYDGTVEFNRLENFGASTSKVGISGGTLKWASGNTADISPKLSSITGSRVFDVNNNNVTFDSIVPYGFTKAGTGKLTLRYANTSTGAVSITAGTLEIGGNNGAVAGNIAVAAGAKLSFNRWGYTYTGVISGAGEVEVNQNVILTGANTYTGATTVNSGNLNIGNGGLTGSIVSNVTFNATHALMFNRSNAYTYSGIISGAGTIFQMGTGTLVLNGANTCTGMVIIYSTGTLELGTNGTLGNNEACLFMGAGKFKITSDKQIGGIAALNTAAEIQLGGMLTIYDTSSAFIPPSSQTFAGIISGTGGINKTGDKSLTLDGVNTYTGMTNVKAGTLILGANGSLASDNITLSRNNISQSTSTYGKLDVSAGNKTLKNLNADYASNEVILGGTNLQIGTSSATGDGSGTFRGIFSGTGGGIAKTGFATLVLSGASTATGTLSNSSGTIEFSGSWAGNYAQAPGAMLDVAGNTSVGGNFMLAGGTISMDLTAATPAKINITGTFSAGNSTTMDISAIAGNFTLIESASGINNLSNFSFASINGLTLTPSLGTDNSKTQLKLGVVVTDVTPPAVSNGTIVADNIAAESLRLVWSLATDNQTPQAQLRYFVYQSSSNNINSIANCEANGTLLNPGGILNISTYAVSGLSPNTTYYFNIVVMDAAGNKLAYGTKSQITNKATLGGTVAISGNAVFGQTLTAVTTALSSNPTIPALGTLSYQWKRGGTNISGATNSTYALVQADIAQTITVTVKAANCIDSVTSQATAAVNKATQTAPLAPVVASKTHNSITLTAVAGNEYRIDGGAWQTTTLFSGLTPETGYTLEARKAETATHFASPVSLATPDTTGAAPIPDKIYQGIQQITAISRPYQSANTVAGLGLPATVSINTDQGTVSGVSVTWNIPAAGYNPASTSTSPQAFTVSGTITLPGGVVNSQGISLAASVQVTVAGRPLVPSITSVTVSPSSVSVQQGNAQQFNATVAAVDGADASVVWSISGNVSVQTYISSAGYLSVDAGESATTIKVVAMSVFDNAKTDTATVTVTVTPVTPQVNSVSVNPSSATVQQGQQQQFTAIVNAAGGASTAVNWTVEDADSAATQIDASGLLSIDANESAATIKVVVTSVFDNTKTDTATIAITLAPAVLQSIQQPTAITGLPNGTLKNETALGLPATVTLLTTKGNKTASVMWDVAVANYDPASYAAQIFDVTGTITLPANVVNTGGISLNVTVNVSVNAAIPQVSGVDIVPNSVSVQKGQTYQFSVMVTAVGGADESVTWQILESGISTQTTIDANGLLSVASDELLNTLTIQATSVFNTALSGTASVTLTDDPVLDKILENIITPAPISGLANGTAKTAAALGLPTNVMLETDQGNISAMVAWNVAASSYDPALTTAQAFTINGTVTLPMGVINPNSISLDVTIDVSVDAASTDPQVTAVVISPNQASVQKGKTQQFTVVVTAVNGADESVTWSVENKTSVETTITQEGLLTVGTYETAESLKVKAVSNFNPGISDEVTVTVSTVGIDEIIPDVIKIFPNPFTDMIQFENAEGSRLEVIDLLGRPVYSTDISSTEESIYLGQLPPGTYVFRIIKDKTVRILKGIKQ